MPNRGIQGWSVAWGAATLLVGCIGADTGRGAGEVEGGGDGDDATNILSIRGDGGDGSGGADAGNTGSGGGNTGSGGGNTGSGGATGATTGHTCAWVRERYRFCDGDESRSLTPVCEDVGPDTPCQDIEPEGSREEESSTCFTRVTYHAAGTGVGNWDPLPATCAEYIEYYELDTIECIVDKHCAGSGFECQDRACTCPAGDTCVCPCEPVADYCDGDTWVEQSTEDACIPQLF